MAHVLLIAAVVAAQAASARADEVRAAPPASAPMPSRRSTIDGEAPREFPSERNPGYQRHLLIVDASALALLLFAIPFESPELAYVGLATYAVGAPVVHGVAHDRTASVWGSSLLMRTFFPIVGGFVGYYLGTSDCSDEFICGAGEMGLGILAGAAAAMAIDHVVFASDHDDDTVRTPRALAATALVPVPVRGGMSLNLGGRF